jgi:peptide/nickel transport system permease protein
MSAVTQAPNLTSRSPGALVPAWLREAPVSVLLAGLIILFFAIAVLFPSLLATSSPTQINLAETLKAPSIHHIFGTDASGRDLYSRVIYGAHLSLLIGLGATALSMSVAVILGVSSGLAGGWVDAVINRGLEVVFAFPVLLLALLLVAVVGPGVKTEIIAVGIGNAPGYARMIRGQVLLVKDAGYVESARALGHPYGKIVRRHIFPNAMRPLLVTITLGIGQAIVWASGMAFIGLGVAPPSPEWGALLDAGRDFITQAWWLEIMPGLAIVLVTLAITMLGRYLQQRLEGGNSR